jgi:hypothetical protein
MITREQVDKAFDRYQTLDWPDDAQRIVDAIAALHGVSITNFEADAFWRWYSDRYAAGWLMLPEDSDVPIAAAFQFFVDEYADVPS